MITKFERIKRNVEQGKHKIFNDWGKWGLISQDEFLSAAKWLSEDPMTSKPWDSFEGRPTRFLGLENIHEMEKRKMCIQHPEDAEMMGIKYNPDKKAKIIKLNRKFSKGLAFYFKEDGTLYDGSIIADIVDFTGPYSVSKVRG